MFGITTTYCDPDLWKINQNYETTDRRPRSNTTAQRINMFNCAVCLEKGEDSGTRVAGHRVCVDCINEYVMPKFHAALKHEHNYPPMWGRDIELDPHEFLAFFDEPNEFVQKYERNEREYRTPIKRRFYCSAAGCGEFLCAKSKNDGSNITFNAHCSHCGGFTCWPCGANVTDNVSKHVCAPQPAEGEKKTDDAFKGLERGRDYQLCPNEDCELPVELRDGCNALVCGQCSTPFCMICGEKAGLNSGHWDFGSACTRWGHPEQPNARHENAELGARLRAALGDHGEIDEMARRVGMEEEGEFENRILRINRDVAMLMEYEEEFEDGPAPIDLLFEDIGRTAYEEIVQNAVGMMNGVPALPDLTDMTAQQQLAAEQNMADELESSPLGQLMLRQRFEVHAMIDIAEARIIEGENEDLLIADWVYTAIDLLTALHDNLFVYVYRARLRTSLVAFEDRHDTLERAYGPHQAQMFRHFRRFYEILVSYSNVAEIRMLGATAALEGQATEEEVVREEVANFEEYFRGNRERDEVLEGVAGLVGQTREADGMEE